MSDVKPVKEILSEVVAKKLVGELLTLVDASYSDKAQREAIKSLVRQSVQKALNELNSQLETQLIDAKAVSQMNAKLEVKVIKGEQDVRH
jgi:sensor domain CHASE-containing protein